MPYIFLALSAVIAILGLYKFFSTATRHQIKSFYFSFIAIVLAVALFYMAVTGKLAAALGLFAALSPFILNIFGSSRKRQESQRLHDDIYSRHQNTSQLSRKDALDVLGLKEEATEEEIRKAYKKLITKVHPDNEGSEWLAAKLNEARDILLKNKEKPDIGM